MPDTALSHFSEDVARARALLDHARSLPNATADERLLRDDLFRAAWMFAVGALDAYFCDAHTDVIAATLIAKSHHPTLVLPAFFDEIRLPVRAVLRQYAAHPNVRWRMAARELMVRESVLSLEAIQRLFNRFFTLGRRLFRDLMPDWIAHPAVHRNLFGIASPRFTALPAAQRGPALTDAHDRFAIRFQEIFQRRHDCIHNCDRPRVRPQPLRAATQVERVLQDVDFLVRRCDEHIDREVREFLFGTGCPAAVIAQVGY